MLFYELQPNGENIQKNLRFMSVLMTMSFMVATNAYALDSMREKQIEEKFKSADKDNDGKLTLEEAKAGMPRVAKAFSKIDASKQGYIVLTTSKQKLIKPLLSKRLPLTTTSV